MEARSHKDILKAVRRIEITTQRAVNAELAGRYSSVFKGQGMAFSQVRAYTPGDDIRHIDWNVSARHQGQGLFIKEFIEERELTTLLMVDMSASASFGSKHESKKNLIAHVAGMLAFSAIQNNDRVGLLLFTDQVELFLAPRKGKSHVLRVIREIVEFKPESRGTSIAEALAYLSRIQKRRAVVFLVSDFLDEGYTEALKLTMARHDVIALRVFDPAEARFPNLGLVNLVDAETGRSVLVDSSDPAFRRQYAAKNHEKAQRQLRQLGLDQVELSCGEDFVRPLVGFFKTRSRRQRTRA